jgi:hypothetical protein
MLPSAEEWGDPLLSFDDDDGGLDEMMTMVTTVTLLSPLKIF